MDLPSTEKSLTPVLRHEDNHAVPEAAVRSELERLLASESLRDSEMLKRFLRYIVEHTLAGKGDQLKEYRLGVDVFDRSASFDPRLDPVVRVTARRLRAKLREHYENGGRDSLVRIEVPKGSYATCFVAATPSDVAPRSDVAGLGDRQSSARPLLISRDWKWTLAATAVLISAALVAGDFYHRSRKTNRLTDKDTVVLADFANTTGDPAFDDTLKTALAVSLRQSPFLNVLSDKKVATTLETMARPVGTRLTAELTRELCQRASSKAYIAGAISGLGSDYVLGLKAVNCQNGDTLAEEQVTASSKEKVLNVLGAAASKLRRELGESLATIQSFDIPLAFATTPSLEALKAYTLGNRAFDEKGAAAALPYYQRTIELDPDFAMGYVTLAEDYATLGQLGRANGFLEKAFQLRQHASARERLRIEGNYYSSVTGDLNKAANAYQEMADSYPHDLPYFSLGYIYGEKGQYEKAAEMTRQSIRIAPNYVPSYENLASFLLALQRFDEARQVLHEAQARKLDDLQLHGASYALAFNAADSAAMAEQLQWFAGKTEYESFGLALLSDSEAYGGHLAKARELTKRAADLAVRGDSSETAALWQATAAQREAVYGNAAAARQMASQALKLDPTSRGVESEAALALAMAGDTTRTKSLAQDLEKRFPLDTQIQSLWLPAIRGQLALEEKKPALALNALQPASIEFGQIMFVNSISCLYAAYERGEAYLADGQGSAAASEFQKLLDHNGIVWNCWTGALARLGVARANALESRTLQGADADAARVRALAAYRDFLMLWKDADPDIPILKRAKAEYAKLQ